MATQIDLGAVVPIGKGDWNASTTYERTNIVRHNSTAWICKVATSTGVEPTESSSDWYLLVKDTSSVTSVNGMIGDVNINSISENPSIDDNSLKIASTSWVKTKIDNATNELNTQISQANSKASTALQTANTANSTANNALSKAEEASNKSGLPLGHIYLWPFSTPPDGSIQLNGSEYNRELYSDLWALIQEKNWYKSESEWQQIASANGGYCPWYSDGDGSTTFRTPKFAPYQKIALASGDSGTYTAEGLPNITSESPINNTILSDVSNAIGYPNPDNNALYGKLHTNGSNFSIEGNDEGFFGLSFDASRSNPIYGNSEHVTPESHDWIVCVVAFGKATNVGNVDVANVMSAVGQVQTEVSTKLEDSTVHIVETWKSNDGSSWYRKWSDGFIEQGSTVKNVTNWVIVSITLLIPFKTTAYTINISGIPWNGDLHANVGTLRQKTETSFSHAFYNNLSIDPTWYACGY